MNGPPLSPFFMQPTAHSTEYQQFVADVKQRIRQAQYQALKAVNKEQIQLNWSGPRWVRQAHC